MMLDIKGDIVIDLQNKHLYFTYFDPEIFSQQAQREYYTIFDLLRRKNSKDIILNILFTMINQKYPIKIFKSIFAKLIQDYKLTVVTDDNIINNIAKLSQDFEISSLQSLMIKKKMCIKPTEICHDLFKPFIYNKKADKVFIIELIVLYLNFLNKEKIKLNSSFNHVIISLLKQISYEKITMLLQYQSFPDSIELANYILHEAIDNDRIYNLGIDMLKRLKKDELIVIELIKKGLIEEALLYTKNKKIQLSAIPQEVISVLENVIKTKKKLIIDFINQ